MCWALVMTSGAGTSLHRADVAGELADPAAADLLLLAQAQVVRVADHAALAAAQRDVHHGALPGHPHGQRADRVDGLLRVEADAALARAAGVVVLDAEAAEDLDRAVVHAHRDAEVVLAHRPAQELARAGVEVQELGDLVELGLGHLEGVERAGLLLGSHGTSSGDRRPGPQGRRTRVGEVLRFPRFWSLPGPGRQTGSGGGRPRGRRARRAPGGPANGLPFPSQYGGPEGTRQCSRRLRIAVIGGGLPGWRRAASRCAGPPSAEWPCPGPPKWHGRGAEAAPRSARGAASGFGQPREPLLRVPRRRGPRDARAPGAGAAAAGAVTT